MAKAATSPHSMPQLEPAMNATRRPYRREIAPVGNVPAASPITNIDNGSVASAGLGASVTPTIEPVAKMTAALAPASACAIARRSTLPRARASPAT